MKSTTYNSLFCCQDYRSALRQRADEWKKLVPGATFQSLAKACRVQKAYLSRVLQEDAELSQDQLFLACQHLGISGHERRFLFTLHAYCRSDVPERRKQLTQDLNELREQAKDTLANISVEPLADTDLERLAPIFLDPDAQLVQLCLTIERFRRKPAALAEALRLEPERITQILAMLRERRLIAIGEDGVMPQRDVMHLPVDSPLFRPYRALLRQRVMAKQAAMADKAGYSFSLLFTANSEVEQYIRQRFLALLKEVEPKVRAAPSEQVYFVGFDLFPWL